MNRTYRENAGALQLPPRIPYCRNTLFKATLSEIALSTSAAIPQYVILQYRNT
jgi:hypothetical protein